MYVSQSQGCQFGGFLQKPASFRFSNSNMSVSSPLQFFHFYAVFAGLPIDPKWIGWLLQYVNAFKHNTHDR